MFTKGISGFSAPCIHRRWENKQLCDPPVGLCRGVFQEGGSRLAKSLRILPKAFSKPSCLPRFWGGVQHVCWKSFQLTSFLTACPPPRKWGSSTPHAPRSAQRARHGPLLMGSVVGILIPSRSCWGEIRILFSGKERPPDALTPRAF